MRDKVGDDFDGYITGVASFGLFVELVEHFVEGLVHVSSMADDYYRFLEPTHTLRGESLGRAYRLGDRVRVRVVRVDMDRRQIELGLVEILDAVAKGRAAGERGAAAPPLRSGNRFGNGSAPVRTPGSGATPLVEPCPATSSSAPPATSITARAPSCWRSRGPIPIG